MTGRERDHTTNSIAVSRYLYHMESARRLKRAIENPRLFVRGFNRAYHRQCGFRTENPDGVAVFDRDWDTLVVLDACRYDMFADVNQLDGDCSSVVSKGSATTEWLQANVDGRDLTDTVYVTANPQLERNKGDWDVRFHDVINCWLDDGWDDEKGTVLAETMTERGIQAFERFPEKRVVVHYMQPHYPFVTSETAVDKRHLQTIQDGDDRATGENIWNLKFFEDLDISEQELWAMYTENLEYALEHVEVLLNAIHGKTVVTSDHGNFVGDRATPIPIREWGHPRGIYAEPLVRVPWLEVSKGDRKSITRGGITDDDSDTADVVADRLRHLGYTE